MAPSVSLAHDWAWTTLFFDQSPCFITDSPPKDDWYSYKLSNGSYLSLNASSSNCAAINQVDFSTAFDVQIEPDWFGSYIYGYKLGGVAVATSALGTPFDSGAYFDISFGNFATTWSLSPLFQYATTCFPILASNPVTCRQTGAVSNAQNEVTVEAEGCKISTPIFSVDSSNAGAGSAGVCTDGHDVGRATIVLGSVNSWAPSLAKQMGVPAASAVNITSYSVACKVDISSSISTTEVKYSRISPGSNGGDVAYNDLYQNRVSFTVVGTGRPCTRRDFNPNYLDVELGEIPLSSVLTERTLAIGAAAHRSVLAENSHRDGTWPSLFKSIPSDFAFNDSTNPLEDRLGLMSAITLGAYWGSSSQTYEEGHSGRSDVYNSGLRVGTGEWWALVYIVPELYSVAFILHPLRKRGGPPRSSTVGI